MATSLENQQDKDRAGQYDFVKGYINKLPTNPDEFLAQISEYLPEQVWFIKLMRAQFKKSLNLTYMWNHLYACLIIK